MLKTVFGNPGYTVTTLLESEKVVYLLQIMTPLAFFAWRRPIGLLCTLPGFFFTLLATTYPPLTEISFQYTAYWTAFLFIAVVANLTWLKRVEREAAQAPDAAVAVPRARASRRAWVVTMAVATLVTSYQMGLVLPAEHGVGRVLAVPRRRHQGRTDPPRRPAFADQDRFRADASVAASEMLVAQISSRKNAYTLRIGHLRRRLHPDSVADGRRRTKHGRRRPAHGRLRAAGREGRVHFVSPRAPRAETPPRPSCVESAR